MWYGRSQEGVPQLNNDLRWMLYGLYQELFQKILKATQETLSSGKEITVHLNDMPNITNAGLYNVVAFIQSGQKIKFLENDWVNIILMIFKNVEILKIAASPPISLLYSAIACLPPFV
ncbi:hypothetical protein QQG55_54160 [Brugia pahangi]